MALTNVFRTDGWVKAVNGYAVPGAQIYVCLQPANIASLPPTPLANIFSDVNGLVPITQPIITDGFGHYNFYAAAGVYTVVVGLNGVIQQVYPDQSVGGASGTSGGGGGTALVLQVNGTPTVKQLLANFIGANSTTVTDNGAGGLVISTVVPVPPGQGSNFPFFNQGYLSFNGGSASLSQGCYGTFVNGLIGSNGTLAAVLPTGTTPSGISITTAAGATNYAGVGFNLGSLSGNITLGTLRSMVCAFKLGSTANIRSWFGIGTVQSSNLTQISVMQTDAPNIDFVGFRYSTAAGDLGWKCITQLHGASVPTQTINAETGSHLDTGMHVFEVQFDGTNAKFYIDSALVGTQSANLTAVSTQLSWSLEVDNVGLANAKAVTCYGVRLASIG